MDPLIGQHLIHDRLDLRIHLDLQLRVLQQILEPGPLGLPQALLLPWDSRRPRCVPSRGPIPSTMLRIPGLLFGLSHRKILRPLEVP